MDGIAASTLALYRQDFAHDVAKGIRRPFVLPYASIGTFALTTVWLAIPHVRRPWLYQTRWLVVALVLAINFDQMWYASSSNIATSYLVGMASTFGSMLCLNLLVWTRPQFEAARVVRVNRKIGTQQPRDKSKSSTNDSLATVAPLSTGSNSHVRRRRDTRASPAQDEPEMVRSSSSKITRDELEIAAFEEYAWQKYPEDAPFLERLGWCADLILSFRGAGKLVESSSSCRL